MLNKVVLIGRLTKDPELKYTLNGKPVATFSIAVNRKYQKMKSIISTLWHGTPWVRM